MVMICFIMFSKKIFLSNIFYDYMLIVSQHVNMLTKLLSSISSATITTNNSYAKQTQPKNYAIKIIKKCHTNNLIS